MNVRLRLYVDPDALVVPASAVVSGQQGSFVFVVQPDSTAATKPVTVDRTAGDLAVVSGEVQPGDGWSPTASSGCARASKVQIKASGRQRPGEGIMNITELFIRRPVMTTLVMVGILIFGLVAYRQLPVSDLPAVDYPTISVSASLPGASPETMASSVATPLEKQFSTIPGIEAMTSTSSQGEHVRSRCSSRSSRDIDAAAQDVQAAISQALRQLPQDMLPPSYQKVNPSSQPILYYALRTHDAAAVAARRVRRDVPRPAALDGRRRGAGAGVRLAEVRGADPARSRSSSRRASIGIDEVSTAVQNGNVNLPTGMLWGTDKALHGREQRPAHQRGRLRRAGRGLPQRRAGAARRTSAG